MFLQIIQALTEAKNRFVELEDTLQVAITLGTLTIPHHLEGNYDVVLQLLGQSREMLVELGEETRVEECEDSIRMIQEDLAES